MGGEVGGGRGGEDGGLRIGGGVTSPLTMWWTHVRLRVHGTLGNTPNQDFLRGGLMGGVCINLESDRAGSRTPSPRPRPRFRPRFSDLSFHQQPCFSVSSSLPLPTYNISLPRYEPCNRPIPLYPNELHCTKSEFWALQNLTFQVKLQLGKIDCWLCVHLASPHQTLLSPTKYTIYQYHSVCPLAGTG